jgi:hypothetical protein
LLGIAVRIFHCDRCEQLVFFENVRCVACGHALAYLPDVGDMGTLEPAGGDTWRRTRAPEARTYRLCTNYDRENVCNWAVPADDPQALCQSCRLTRVIPDLGRHRDAWYRLEVAKRRLVYGLMRHGLPIASKRDDPERGLTFEFLADPDDPDAPPVMTGHADGVVTISVAEADDAQRERRRLQLHEPYRTLLGHFRHESGHYYWARLVERGPRLARFREVFGDERAGYADALARHYEQGAPPDWQQRFVSAYASVHPWEDWAETWAHFLHMSDSIETAAACGLMLRPRHPDEPALVTPPDARPAGSFDRMVRDWFPLTYVLNNLNRGLGLPDGYPFVLSTPAIEKLRFVHETIEAG